VGTLKRTTLEIGSTLGKYRILRRLATGGMAEIYLAVAQGAAGFEKLVVLKRILPAVSRDRKLVEMFMDEARIASSLRHANIADVFDFGLDDGSHFLVMEYVFGQDARTIILETAAVRQRVPIEIGIAIAAGTAAALAYAHDASGPNGPLELVHRDVSPSNILVSYDGAVKLVDFGIARATARTRAITRTGTLKGKVPYMSPEQCQGQRLDRRSDLFSLGTVLYELTTGARPFLADGEFALMENIVNRDARAPAHFIIDYPRELSRIVMKLLARKLRDRYETARDVVDDLDAFASEQRLGVSSLALSKYMRDLFAVELEESELATQRGRSLADHLAQAPSRADRLRARMTPVAVPARAPREPIPEPTKSQSDAVPLAAETGNKITTPYRPPTPQRVATQPPPQPVTGLGIPRPFLDTDAVRLPDAEYPAIPRDAFAVEEGTRQSGVPTQAPPKASTDFGAEDHDTRTDTGFAFADPLDIYRAELEDELREESANGAADNERISRRFKDLVDRAAVSLALGEVDKAVVTAELAMAQAPESELGEKLIAVDRDTLTACFATYLGDTKRDVALARQLEDVACLPVGPRAAFLLSRIDGLVSIDDVIDMSGMVRLDACRHLCQLLMLGILVRQ